MTDVVNRPWGTYETILESDNYKVKRIIVKPHSQLSLQSHITGLPLERKMDLLIRAVIKQRMKGYISDINQEVNVDLINST